MAPELVDFSVGLTDPASFPVEELAAVAAQAIREVGTGFARYPGNLGHSGLREVVAERESKREGVEVDPEWIALTNGSMQAVTLVGRVLMTAPGDVIVTEEVTYPGTIRAYKGLGARLIGVPVDEHGMQVDRLTESLERLQDEGTPARFIYTLPTFQNPTGTVLSLDRRRALLEVARRFDVQVVEDNCYADVHYDGDVPPSLYTMDDSVIYLGSLSKIFGAGVRLGYLMARPPLLGRIVEQRFDAGHSLLSASIAAAYLKDSLWAHVTRHNAALERKRDALVEALEESLADGCSWSPPQGGLFLWLGLPAETDLDELERTAAEAGVAYGRGRHFHVEGRDIPYLRLAFGHATVPQIGEGIGRLADSIRAVSSARPRRASS